MARSRKTTPAARAGSPCRARSGELARSLVAGESQVALVPMIVALHMQKARPSAAWAWLPTVLRAPELGDDVLRHLAAPP